LASQLDVETRVHFMGHRSRQEVLQAVAGAHAFLFTSTHDSSPGAVAEALTIGTPVVCLDNGGAGDLLRAAGKGAVVDSRSGDFLTKLRVALEAVTEEGPSERFASSRVPQHLDEWYHRAIRNGPG